MPDGLTFKLNTAEVVKNITLAQTKVDEIITKSLKDFALGTVNDAKRLAPVDEGVLRNSIGFVASPLKVTITVNVPYAAYLEFGTKRFAAEYVSSLPGEWIEFAAQFKGGKGGSFQEFVKVLTEWVIRKGFAALKTSSGNRSKSKDSLAAQHQAAYLIARSILIKGIRPHPYLYPAYNKNRIELINNLKAQLSK